MCWFAKESVLECECSKEKEKEKKRKITAALKNASFVITIFKVQSPKLTHMHHVHCFIQL